MTGYEYAKKIGIVPKYEPPPEDATREQRDAHHEDFRAKLEQMTHDFEIATNRKRFLPRPGPRPAEPPPPPETPKIFVPPAGIASLDRYRSQMARADRMTSEEAAERIRAQAKKTWAKELAAVEKARPAREAARKKRDAAYAEYLVENDRWLDTCHFPTLAERVLHEETEKAWDRRRLDRRAKRFERMDRLRAAVPYLIVAGFVAVGAGIAAVVFFA